MSETVPGHAEMVGLKPAPPHDVYGPFMPIARAIVREYLEEWDDVRAETNNTDVWSTAEDMLRIRIASAIALSTPIAAHGAGQGEAIVPVAWVKPDWQNTANYDGMSPVTVYERRDWNPLIRLSDHTDALASLRAKLATAERERDNWYSVFTHNAEAARNAVAKSIDLEGRLEAAEAELAAVALERDELDCLLNEGGSWELQLTKAEARAEAAEAEVARLKDENKAPRELIERLWGALNFILAFYEPQNYLDTEAWKQAEASGRSARQAASEWLDARKALTAAKGG
jgi:hypothetical protein